MASWSSECVFELTVCNRVNKAELMQVSLIDWKCVFKFDDVFLSYVIITLSNLITFSRQSIIKQFKNNMTINSSIIKIND